MQVGKTEKILKRLTIKTIHPYPFKLIYLYFQPLEVVSRYRDPQPQVVENYSYLFNSRPNIKFTHFDVQTVISCPITVN